MLFKANSKQDQIMFLYKFVEGSCDSSFGMNVARMAGIPPRILEVGRRKSNEFTLNLNRITSQIQSRRPHK